MRALLSIIALFVIVISSVTTAPCDQVTDLFTKGKNCLNAEDYDEAIKNFSVALNSLEANSCNYHIVLLTRAQAHYGKEDFISAWKDLDHLFGSTCLDAETLALGLNLKGMLLQKKGNDKASIREFTAAIKAPHDNTQLRASSFAKRGIVHLNGGKTDAAVSDFNKAIDLESGYAYAYAGRGLAYLRADKIEAAKRDANHAMTLKPDNATTKLATSVLNEMTTHVAGPHNVSVSISDSGHVFVQLKFGKFGKPHRFLLDTGATYSLVNPELLNEIRKECNIEALGTSKVRIADGSLHTVTRYKAKDAFLYDLPLGDLEFHCFNGKTRGNEIINLFGVKGYRNISVSMDYGKKKAEFKRSDSTEVE